VFDGEHGILPASAAARGRTVRAISNTRTPGAAGARNAGALAARAPLLAFCDDDDEWLPDKLDRQVAVLRRQRDVSAVTCGIEVVYDDRAVVRMPQKVTVTLSDLLRSRLAELHTSTILVERKDFLGAIGPFDEAIPGSYGEDYEWLLRAARQAPVAAVRGPFARIHWHDASLFEGRWNTMVAGLRYLLNKHPELAQTRKGLARIYGQLAFASAAAGGRRQSFRLTGATVKLDWRQPRAYLALLVSVGLLRPPLLLHVLHRFGRGI
jgi:glycosyltransferase involved in cell wall biosynthesis